MLLRHFLATALLFGCSRAAVPVAAPAVPEMATPACETSMTRPARETSTKLGRRRRAARLSPPFAGNTGTRRVDGGDVASSVELATIAAR